MKEKTLPKTTSGKNQRRKTRTLLHNGGLDVVYELSDASGGATTAAAGFTTPITANDLPVLEAPLPAPETTAAVAHANKQALFALLENLAASSFSEPSYDPFTGNPASSDNDDMVRNYSPGSRTGALNVFSGNGCLFFPGALSSPLHPGTCGEGS